MLNNTLYTLQSEHKNELRGWRLNEKLVVSDYTNRRTGIKVTRRVIKRSKWPNRRKAENSLTKRRSTYQLADSLRLVRSAGSRRPGRICSLDGGKEEEELKISKGVGERRWWRRRLLAQAAVNWTVQLKFITEFNRRSRNSRNSIQWIVSMQQRVARKHLHRTMNKTGLKV